MTTKLTSCSKEWGERCFWLRWFLECDFEWMAVRLHPKSKRLGYVTAQSDGTAIWSA